MDKTLADAPKEAPERWITTRVMDWLECLFLAGASRMRCCNTYFLCLNRRLFSCRNETEECRGYGRAAYFLASAQTRDVAALALAVAYITSPRRGAV
jgi:hypothetical protein